MQSLSLSASMERLCKAPEASLHRNNTERKRVCSATHSGDSPIDASKIQVGLGDELSHFRGSKSAIRAILLNVGAESCHPRTVEAFLVSYPIPAASLGLKTTKSLRIRFECRLRVCASGISLGTGHERMLSLKLKEVTDPTPRFL